MAWLPRTKDNLITSTIWCGTHNRAGLQFKCVLTENPPSPGEVGHTTGVYVPYSFRTVVWVLLRPTIVLWRHFVNVVHTHDNFLERTLRKQCSLSSHFDAFLFRKTSIASIDRTELHASLTNWMRDSRKRFVSSWQFRCFLVLITSKSAATALTGAFIANQWRKIKLGSFASIWKKHQSTDLESERNLRMKRERMEVSLHFAKLAVNVPNAHCRVYLYRRWWFLLLLFAKSSKINFLLDLFRLERDDYETFRKPSERVCPKGNKLISEGPLVL